MANRGYARNRGLQLSACGQDRATLTITHADDCPACAREEAREARRLGITPDADDDN